LEGGLHDGGYAHEFVVGQVDTPELLLVAVELLEVDLKGRLLEVLKIQVNDIGANGHLRAGLALVQRALVVEPSLHQTSRLVFLRLQQRVVVRRGL
jgi:hypothetical protein